MMIPPTKNYVPLTKYDIPLPPTGSPAKRQDHLRRQYIPHGKREYEVLSLSCKNVPFQGT